MKKTYRLTQSGVDELKAERERLLDSRFGIAEAIKTAREFGDLSENAEYQSARQDQDKHEARLSEIETILRNVTIIKKPKVILKNSGKTKEFQVVGTVEADPLAGKISDESPLGKAVLGRQEGDSVEIKTVNETTQYVIVDIS